MGQPKEYTWPQQLTRTWSPWARNLFRIDDFTAPASDCPPTRFTVTDEVTASVPIEWPDYAAWRGGVDYLRRVYGRVGGRRIQSAHVATASQLQASEHLTPTAADPADLVDPAVSWGLSGRLEMVARLLGAGWPKWQIAAACGVTPGQVSRACARLREVA